MDIRRRPAAFLFAALTATLVIATLALHTVTPEAGGQATVPCHGANMEANAMTKAQFASTLVCVINDERRLAGRSPLRSNLKLTLAASGHAEMMVDQGFFSHTCPSGETFVQRIRATGYMRGASSWLVGENLAWGTHSMSSPQSTVERWMASPTHRANLLRKRFRDIGAAGARGTPHAAQDEDGVTVETDFGSRRKKR